MVTLEASKPFRLLDPAELAMLRKVAEERQFSAGQDIFREGDSGDGVYLLKDGLVEISVNVGQNQRRVFSRLTPGELFGEMAVLELKPRSATATAVQDSVAYFIPRAELLATVQRSALFSLELLREISQRLRDFNQRYVQEILQTERLAIIGRFARAIVHDLKNPLNIIGLTAEVMGMEQAPKEVRDKAAGNIHKQVARISDLVSEILEFTQGGEDTHLSPTPLREFVGELLEELRGEVELRGCQFQAEEIPEVRLMVDPRRLRRVFFNLVHNATDVMPNGGSVTIRFGADSSELTVGIEDTGPGIAPEMTDKLFEVFATHGKAHGTGLGLSICKKIVEDHGGRIWATSEPGRGAVFAFTLPLLK